MLQLYVQLMDSSGLVAVSGGSNQFIATGRDLQEIQVQGYFRLHRIPLCIVAAETSMWTVSVLVSQT